MSGEVERAREIIAGAERIVVLTGAGVSAESGVPTFRGSAGLWKSHRPEQLATPEAFARDPRTVWEWYAWRRDIVAGCAPNAAHLALAHLALVREGVSLVTQNVDGLHHRAADEVAGETQGATAAYPLEVHGAIHRDRCSHCARRTPALTTVDTSSSATLPRCQVCDGLLRPDVVWFGELLDRHVIDASFGAARRADLCLVVGTSSVVYPAAAIPEIALSGGAHVVEINPEATPLSRSATASVRGPAGDLLPGLIGWEAAERRAPSRT